MIHFLKSLAHDRAGNFGLFTALLAVPVLGTIGMGLDLSHAVLRKTELQDALDSAVLAAASTSDLTKSQMDKIAQDTLAAALPNDLSFKTVAGELQFLKDGQISLAATTHVPLTIGKILFKEGLKVSALSRATRSASDESKLEIAMVLDNTYSMYGTKLADLKLAANTLLDAFSKQKDGSVRFALVPFSRYVNVGTDNRQKAWLDVKADYSVTKNVCTKTKPVIGKSGCKRVTTTSVRDGVPVTSTKEQCESYTYGPETTVCSDKVTNYTWQGCVGSRAYPYDVQDTQPQRKYTGLQNTSCGSALVPLTSDYATLRAAIKAMVANNETYIPAGILWGWNVLSSSEPFAQASNDKGVQKFMIVMTDGANTLSPHKSNYTLHTGTKVDEADDLMTEVCTNAKNAGITVFTVAVGISGTSTEKEIAKCSTDNTKAISVEDTAKLADVFNRIGAQITMPRLTQ
ncbi:MAG: pilus assembly protein [Proteobacteria bacterium]|nr:pilus assembly protein [Pseudomonadota bacterium]